MSKPRILITGASGNVGREIVKALQRFHADAADIVLAATTLKESKDGDSAMETVEFDFMRPDTVKAALRGITTLFLLRPPPISDVPRYIAPAIDAAKAAGVGHIVFLSLNGVEKQTRTPHYAIEQYLRTSGVEWTFLRPSFFMQNLSTTHLEEIRRRSEIFVPAGKGKTNFVDVRDIGEAAAHILANPEAHKGQAYDLTGSTSYTYDEIAAILTSELGRTIRYANPSKLHFFWRKWREGTSITFTLVMIYLYHQTVKGAAEVYAPDLVRLLGHPPRTVAEFVHDARGVWLE
jgi:uncharacterized protein YbjT (DUF2867 family)